MKQDNWRVKRKKQERNVIILSIEKLEFYTGNKG